MNHYLVKAVFPATNAFRPFSIYYLKTNFAHIKPFHTKKFFIFKVAVVPTANAAPGWGPAVVPPPGPNSGWSPPVSGPSSPLWASGPQSGSSLEQETAKKRSALIDFEDHENGPSPSKRRMREEENENGYNSEDEYNHFGVQLTEEEWVEKDRKFEQTMRKKGYIIKKMVEDGSCLFRAVADQLYGDQEMHANVRKHCMDYIVRYFGQMQFIQF